MWPSYQNQQKWVTSTSRKYRYLMNLSSLPLHLQNSLGSWNVCVELTERRVEDHQKDNGWVKIKF